MRPRQQKWHFSLPSFQFDIKTNLRKEFGFDVLDFTSVAVALEQTFLVTIPQEDISNSMDTPFEIGELICKLLYIM